MVAKALFSKAGLAVAAAELAGQISEQDIALAPPENKMEEEAKYRLQLEHISIQHEGACSIQIRLQRKYVCRGDRSTNQLNDTGES